MMNFFTLDFDIFSTTNIAFDYVNFAKKGIPETVTIAETVLVSSTDNSGVVSVFDFSTLDNHGFISSGNPSRDGVVMVGEDNVLTNATGARIVAAGAGVRMDNAAATVENSGSIEALGFDGVDFDTEASHATLRNSGSIFGRSDGVGMLSAVDGGVIENSGTITSSDSGVVIGTLTGGKTVIVNSGLIQGGHFAIRVDIGAISLNNQGTIDGNILLDASGLDNNVIVNRGKIDGTVQLGGNDVFDGRRGIAPVISAGRGNDRIIAGKGKVEIDVGTGNNVITAGPGHDQFFFTDPLAGQVDKITNFDPGRDKIDLGLFFFPGIGPARGNQALAAADFHVGTHATTHTQHIVYNPADGFLFFDPNGSAGPQIHFATLLSHPALTHADFLIAV